MKYRKFGKSDWNVSALGFGCMRLPVLGDNPVGNEIDEDLAIKMIRHAIDSGVNYVDTAYPYHMGKSEIVTGKALGDGYRDKVRLATKSPVWMIKEQDDFDKYLDQQLKKLDTDHIDYYLFHGLGENTWGNIVLKHNLLVKAEDAVSDGRIGHIGFSFHDKYEVFKDIVDGYDRWEFCQVQYNYIDVDSQSGIKGLRYAAEKGLAIVIMEPLLGGKLASPPKLVRTLFEETGNSHTPADLALQWLWSQPEISVVLSGMSAMNQVEENLASAETSGELLNHEDLALIEKVRQKFLELSPIPCTKCNYCLPCPNGVVIPRNFDIYNDGVIFDNLKEAAGLYFRLGSFFGESFMAKSCVQCGICEEKCPQKIPISEWMPKVHEEFSKVIL